MDVFEVIIAPFLFIIKELFLLSYQLTGNYGISIVLLSFGISALLLPIFILIEKAKKKDDAVKLKMKPLVDEIKRCYKGQERYYYLKTLNRQFNYNPLKALIPILSLLLQIPFFIAAYQFLEHYEPLAGVSFLFIKDLNAPDGLLGQINILPIAMTLVNLLTAYFYTRNGNTSERKQMLVIAIAFLVLLFKLPAGLVLYWTMNNVFSFLRMFITNPEVFKKPLKQKSKKVPFFNNFKTELTPLISVLRKAFYILLVLALIGQLNWALQNNFNDIVLRLIGAVIGSFIIIFLVAITIFVYNKYMSVLADIQIKPKLFFALLFFSIYFYLAGRFYYEEANSILNFIATVAVILLQSIGLLYFLRKLKDTKPAILQLAFFLILFTFISQLFSFIVLLGGGPIILNFFNLIIRVENATASNFIFYGLLFSIITLPFYWISNGIKLHTSNKSNWVIYLLSVVYLSGFIFIWNPLSVFSSFPETFNFFAIDIIKNNISLFIEAVIISFILYLVVPNKIKWILLVFILTLTSLSFIHNTIFPINLGSLFEGHFENPENLALPIYCYILESFSILAILAGIIWVLKRKHFVHLRFSLIILNILLIVQGYYEAYNSDKFKFDENKVLNFKNSISFSKTEQNVIYLIPDAFQGWGMNRMMKENQDLKEKLNGFVWYPNTLAISRVTNTSIGPLMGGSDYAPDILQKDESRSNNQKISDINQELANRVRKNNYLFTSNQLPYSVIDEKSYDTFLPSWHKDWDLFYDELGIDVTLESGYSLLWNNALFFSAPLIFKSKIYNNGNWFNTKKSKINKNTSEYMKYHFFRLLPRISNTKSKKGNFILIYSQATHHPWHKVNKDGTITRDVSPYQNNLWLMRTLDKWFDWMKENDVYDNTKIVIVSDHGAHWKQWKGDVDIDIPFKNITDKIIPLKYLLNLNPLLLVKDFNSKNPFSEDWRFLSNMDAPAIAFDENDPTKLEPIINRKIPAYISWWSRDMGEKNKFSLQTQYEVTNNIFNGDNWTIKKKY